MIRALLALLLLVTPASADSILLLGAGGKKPSAAAPSYSGPGDVVSGATFWGSCARVYNLAAASTSTNLCDLVAVTGGAAVCTLRGSSTGFVDLAASYCAGTTPAAACAAASGGSCKVSKIYDQSGGSYPLEQPTLANMPALTFSALGGLPCISFTRADNQYFQTYTTQTIAQPYTVSTVAKITGNYTDEQGLARGGPSLYGFGKWNVANEWMLTGGSIVTFTNTDNAWHSVHGVLNNTASIGVSDSTATTGLSAGTGDLVTTDFFNLGAAGGFHRMQGDVCEIGIWPSAFNATQYGNMNTNQHSAANGYNF